MARVSVIQSVHHDAIHFVEVVTDGPNAAESRRVFYDSKRHRYKVIISQIILGEILAVILGKYGSYGEHEARLSKLLKAIYDSGADIGSSLVTFDPWKMRQMVEELTDMDSRLKRTDLIVLVLALSDPNSVRLFTRDSVLIRNERIIEYERRMRESGQRNVQLKIMHTL